ncbi:MAG: hypothetical protein ABW184_00630 [Sphingobium sp.]
MIAIRPLSGAALVAALDDLAALRIAVYREWPCVYEGDHACEHGYLSAYSASDRAVIVGAYVDDGRPVGGATAAPMADHAAAFAEPFRERGMGMASFH